MTLEKALDMQMKDEDFKKEYDSLEQEYQIISSFIDVNKSQDITHKQFELNYPKDWCDLFGSVQDSTFFPIK